jgi:hypothetical protein
MFRENEVQFKKTKNHQINQPNYIKDRISGNSTEIHSKFKNQVEINLNFNLQFRSFAFNHVFNQLMLIGNCMLKAIKRIKKYWK